MSIQKSKLEKKEERQFLKEKNRINARYKKIKTGEVRNLYNSLLDLLETRLTVFIEIHDKEYNEKPPEYMDKIKRLLYLSRVLLFGAEWCDDPDKDKHNFFVLDEIRGKEFSEILSDTFFGLWL